MPMLPKSNSIYEPSHSASVFKTLIFQSNFFHYALKSLIDPFIVEKNTAV